MSQSPLPRVQQPADGVPENQYFQQSRPYDEHRSSPRPNNNEYPAIAAGAADVPVTITPIRYAQNPAIGPAAPIVPAVAVAMPQPPMLPLGAVPYNGGVLFSSNVFANSYRVPGPNGSDYVYYDSSMPLPPQPNYPNTNEQWNSMTTLLKLFWILLFVFWIIQLTVHWTVGLCLPILFIPTYLLYRQWQQQYDSVELYLLAKLYAIGFAPGALVVMIVEF